MEQRKMSHRREDAGQLIGSAPGMYYEKVYLILTGLHSVIEPHFAGFLHAFSLSQIVDVYKEVVSKLCQKALYPVEDRVLLIICSQPPSLAFWPLQIVRLETYLYTF